jgi:hypothetical protein
MLKATLMIDLGKKSPDEYIAAIGRDIRHARNGTYIIGQGNTIVVRVEADEIGAMLASLNGALKRLRVVAGVEAGLAGRRGRKARFIEGRLQGRARALPLNR